MNGKYEMREYGKQTVWASFICILWLAKSSVASADLTIWLAFVDKRVDEDDEEFIELAEFCELEVVGEGGTRGEVVADYRQRMWESTGFTKDHHHSTHRG